jgi:polyphosphate kinase 2 (PPK2 family)
MNNQREINGHAKIGREEYEKQLCKLQIEFRKPEDWVKYKGLRIIVLFEGRRAGKGATIKAITERVSPPVFRVVALPAPSDREKVRCTCSGTWSTIRQWGRSLSSIAVGITAPGSSMSCVFAPKNGINGFLERCPIVERYITSGGIMQLKFWVEVLG